MSLPPNKIDQRKVAEVSRRVTWHGRYFRCLCPFHDDAEPSMLVYADGAFCMGSCNRQFSLYVVWAKQTKQMTGATAYERSPDSIIKWWKLPPLPEIAADGNEILLRYRSQRQYLIARGLENRIEPQSLGWWTGWITVPIFNEFHEFQGLVLRATPMVEKQTNQRYMLPPDQPPMLYVPDWHRIHMALKNQKTILVVYGIFDALAMAELSLPVITFSSGKKGSFLGAELLDKFRTRLLVFPDKGEEGTARSLIEKLGWRGRLADIRYPDDCKDPAQFVEQNRAKDLLTQLARQM